MRTALRRLVRPGDGVVPAETPEPSEPTDRPIFFVHVMKTGGTTVFRHLRENYGLDEIYPYKALDLRYEDGRLDIAHHLSVSYLLALPPERRARIRIYTGHFPFVASELLGVDPIRVTILRDPVERTVSLLRQFRRKDLWMREVEQHPDMVGRTLEDVYDHPDVFEPLIHNHQTKVFSFTAEDAPESYMDVLQVDEARLALAKENVAKIDVLGLTERYDTFLDDVSAWFDWQVDRKARANDTPASAKEPVDPALLQRIRADNALDIELYEHARRLHDERHPGRANA